MEATEVLSRTGLNLHLCVKSLKEMFDIHPHLPWEENEIKVLFSNTISFYRLSLQYMFVSEYCKLLEPVSERFPENNISSLSQLIKAALDKDPTFKMEFDRKSNDILQIVNNPFSREMRVLRDKQLVHSDAEISEPGAFKGFTLEEIEIGFMLLRDMRSIIHACGKPIGTGMIINIPDMDDQSQMFIRNHSKLFENTHLLLTGGHTRPFFPHARNPY